MKKLLLTILLFFAVLFIPSNIGNTLSADQPGMYYDCYYEYEYDYYYGVWYEYEVCGWYYY